MTTVEDLLGTTIAGRYRLAELIGHGAMGAVFRATTPTGGDVALKVILPNAEGRSLLPRFLREARLAGRIHHPHVARVHDSGRFGTDKLAVYLAMELVPGLSLRALLDTGLASASVVGLMLQVLEALAHVHARDVLHRDIKPDNILVNREPSTGQLFVKVVDFGIAAGLKDSDTTRLTDAGDTLGTPAYMAPEQALGDGLHGPAVDLYPVGVLLYRMLSGRLPVEGAVTRVLYGKVAEDAPAVRGRHGENLEPALEATIMRLLSRQPSDRPGLAADVIQSLTRFSEPPRATAKQWAEAGGSEDAWSPETNVSTTVPGRGRELGRMEVVAEQVEAGAGRIIVLRGPLGVGKTALMGAFAAGVAERGRFTVLRVANRRDMAADEGLRCALDRLLGTEGRSPEKTRDVAGQLLERLDATDDLDPLMQLLRPDGAEMVGVALRDRNHALLIRLLRRMAVERPILVTIDDAAAGGEDAAALLTSLLFETGFEPARILAVATVRDGESDGFDAAMARSDRLENRSRVTLDVGPLDYDVLATVLAEEGEITLEAAKTIARRAGGNPLFAAQLARAGQANPGDHTLPEVLRSLLERQMKQRLGDNTELREVLIHAAVLGESAAVPTLVALLERDATKVDDDLDGLIDRGLLSDGTGQDIVRMDGLLRDALLGGLSPRRARRLHSRAGDLRLGVGSSPAEIAAAANHLAQAGRAEEATKAWISAFAGALQGGGLALSARCGRAALQGMADTDSRRPQIAVALGRLLADTGELAGAEAVLQSVIHGPDHDGALLAGDALGDLYETEGAGEAWVELLKTLDEHVIDASPIGRRALCRARALWFNVQGRPDLALPLAEEALAGAEPGEERQRAAQRLAFSRMISGDVDGAVESARMALQESEGRRDLYMRSRRTLVNMLSAAGETQEAVRLAEEALVDTRRMGAVTRVPIALLDLGLALRDAGDGPRIRQLLASAVRASRELGFEGAALQAQFHLVLQDLIEGQVDGTVETMAYLAQRAEKAGFEFVKLVEKPFAAWAAAHGGKFDRARALLSDAGDLSHLPTVSAVGYTAAGLAEAFTRGVRAGRTDLHPDALRLWDLALRTWTALRRDNLVTIAAREIETLRS
jgi:tetratricopeptide (TPR) repeat protein